MEQEKKNLKKQWLEILQIWSFINLQIYRFLKS
jgi:hypothetical protein